MCRCADMQARIVLAASKCTPVFVFYILFLLFINVVTWFIVRNLGDWLKKLDKIIDEMAEGTIVNKIPYTKENEIGRIVSSLNRLISSSSKTSEFSKESST
mgnify:CR=1 FL=1